MRGALYVLCFSCLAVSANGPGVAAQEIVKNNLPVKVCYAGNKTTRIYIPPPDGFFKNRGRKGATIKVSYSGFNTLSKEAFNYAVSILASVLPAGSEFTVKAVFEPISEEGVLARSSSSYFVKGSFVNAPEPDAFYPAALAEKISGKSLNPDNEDDIKITINSLITWYLGTSGNTPSDKYDLVTVVLHELIHGIGLFDSFNVSDSLGSFGFYGIPMIYDKFIEDEAGKRLTDSLIYANPSGKLKNILTGNQIWFRGPVQTALNPSGRIRLYAPFTWDPGSSIAHFDEAVTPRSEALMTPFIDRGEAIHSPGILVKSVLGDIGWINTAIIHKPFTDTEENMTTINFRAVIRSDTTFQKERVGLIYSFNNFTTRDTLFLVPPSTDDTFRISLPVPSYNVPVSYSFFTTDCFGRLFRLPSSSSTPFYSFYIGTDTVKPVLKHTPSKILLSLNPVYRIAAEASDNIGIDTVYVEYKINGGSSSFTALKREDNTRYSGQINLKELSLMEGDTLKYRIIALDSAGSPNTGMLPEKGFFAVGVARSYPVTGLYETDFKDAGNMFLNDGFSITRPDQFDDEALHTKHPYGSPENDNDSIEYFSYLLVPVKVDNAGMIITFKEIVLVEPGEDGSVFGSEDFYDYVIVEGSKDFGSRWLPLIDGYDSRISSSFLNAYNSAMNGINSSYYGNQTMYQKRTIDLRNFNGFSPGDTIFIRFRLFSDPYAHGWGWAVDNLAVKPVTSGTEDITEIRASIYPNPGNGLISIVPDRFNSSGTIDYSVSDASGVIIRSGFLANGSVSAIDITGNPPGIYFITFCHGNKITVFRYIKIR